VPPVVASGTTFNLTANFTDAGTNDTHTATVDWGDMSSDPATITETNGSGSLSASHSYADTGLYPVTVTLTDDDGGVSVQNVNVLVSGSPVADAGGPYTGSEGTPTGLVGIATDPDDDPLTISWTFTTDSSDAGTVCTPAGTSTLAPSITCNDDALLTAELSASDGFNPPAVSQTSVTIDNVAPVLGPLTAPGAPLPTGGTANVSASFTDISTNDTHTATVNWGDLNTTNATITETNGSGSLSASHPYASPGLYTITVTLTDDNGGIDTATAQVLVSAAPTADAGGPYVGLEGSQMSLTGTADDVDGDDLTYTWTFDATGDAGLVCTPTGADSLTPTLTCNDDAVVDATLTVSDGINPPVSSTTSITVGNVAPVGGAVVPSDTLVPTNSTVSVTQTFTDAGTNDTHTATIDWGDTTSSAGAVTESAGSGSVTGTHEYDEAGTYTITVTITDDDGDESVGTAQVVVNNSPTANAGGPYSGVEGSPVTLAGSATDPDTNDDLTTTWDITWTGDPGTGCLLTGATTLTPAITCTDDASVTATLTVNDGVNPPVTDSASVDIDNADPVVGALTLPTSATPVGTPVSASTTFVDAGSNDTHTATINWGDSTSSPGTVVETNGVGSVSGSHTYTGSGTFTVTITVHDDDGGDGSEDGSVTINGSPVAGAGGPYTGLEGNGITLSGSASDPDLDDLTVSWTHTISSSDVGTTCAFTGTSTLTPTLTCTDDAEVDVTTTVDDGVNPTVTDSTTVTVDNAAPDVAPVNASPNPVATGSPVNVNTAFTDDGTNDTHTATINWGDTTSSAGTVVETNGSGTVTGSHSYSAPGTYHVTVTVTDDNGGVGTSSEDVVVDGAPVVNAGGPYNGVEGAGVTLGASATDPDGGSLTISWAHTIVTADPGTVCNFTGTSTVTPTLTCNDDALVNVTITANDGINPPVSATTTVTLANVVPSVATPTLTPNPVATGSPASLSAAFTDQGTNDTHTASINWGDSSTTAGTVSEVLGSGTVTGSHVYSSPGTFIVTLTVNDKDGGVTSVTASIVVNAPPTASAGGPYAGNEGSPVTLAGTAGDTDGDPVGVSWGITWSGGPGTSCALAGGTTLTPTVTCNDDATVTATLTATDGVNAPVSSAATVNVANVAPNVNPLNVPTSPVATGTSITVSTTFSDAGTNDTHTATINWGDSSTTSGTVSEVLGAGSASGSHAYSAAGAYTVTLTVTDDNGGATTVTAATPVAVYSPTDHGWTAGAGIVGSPSQAYTPTNTSDPNHQGLAGFAFVAAQPPTGSAWEGTAFALHSAGMVFTSIGTATLNFPASNRAYYTATGKVNGVSGYSVLVSGVDGGWFFGDKFRIKIWNTSTGEIIYDNQHGASDSAAATQLVCLGAVVVRT
jgi:uncharacterized protein with PIN domain